MSNRPSKLDSEYLRARLKLKHLSSEQSLFKKYPKAFDFLKTKNLLIPSKIREQTTKLLASGAIAGSLFLSSPKIEYLNPVLNKYYAQEKVVGDLNKTLSLKLRSILPQKIEPLNEEQEMRISHLLHQYFGIHAVPSLGSTKLNNVYGLIGAEQHLPRFPGDNISLHDEYQKAGMTPGVGAWGYFVKSKNELTPEVIAMEKYYVAVQTLYLPDWNERLSYLYNWYRYRKVIVVNPINGRAIVAVVADAGPAKWTGKHFGGSPEVMAYLGLNVGKQKGPVILYFIDNSEIDVPLGPLEYNLERVSLASR